MDREEVLLLLREIMRVFETFNEVPIVSITSDKESGNWQLKVNWVPVQQEKASVESIAAKHNAKVVEEEGYTVFC